MLGTRNQLPVTSFREFKKNNAMMKTVLEKINQPRFALSCSLISD